MYQLHLVGAEYILIPCKRCDGKGKLPFEDWQRPDGQWVKGGGFKPCPQCNGKKFAISWKCEGDNGENSNSIISSSIC